MKNFIDENMDGWLADWEEFDADAPAQAVRSAISLAVRETIARCAEVANMGRHYAEGDIRSVASAIRSLTETNDPWDENSR